MAPAASYASYLCGVLPSLRRDDYHIQRPRFGRQLKPLTEASAEFRVHHLLKLRPPTASLGLYRDVAGSQHPLSHVCTEYGLRFHHTPQETNRHNLFKRRLPLTVETVKSSITVHVHNATPRRYRSTFSARCQFWMICGALTLALQVPAAPPAKLQTAWYLAAWTLGTSDTCTFGLHPTTTILQRIRQPAICAFQARSAKRVDGVLRIYANAAHAASRWRAVITRLKVCMIGGWSRSTTEQYSVRRTEDGLRTTYYACCSFGFVGMLVPSVIPMGRSTLRCPRCLSTSSPPWDVWIPYSSFPRGFIECFCLFRLLGAFDMAYYHCFPQAVRARCVAEMCLE